MKLICHPSCIMSPPYLSKQRWQWLAATLAACWILSHLVCMRGEKKKVPVQSAVITGTAGIERNSYIYNYALWLSSSASFFFFHLPPKIMDQSTADTSQRNLSWEVQLFLPHIPPYFSSNLICMKIELMFYLFLPSETTLRVPSGCRDLYVLNKNKRKDSHCPCTCWHIL